MENISRYWHILPVIEICLVILQYPSGYWRILWRWLATLASSMPCQRCRGTLLFNYQTPMVVNADATLTNSDKILVTPISNVIAFLSENFSHMAPLACLCVVKETSGRWLYSSVVFNIGILAH